MAETVLLTGLFKLTIAIIGFMLARLCLYWMDKFLTTAKFTSWLDNSNDIAKAVYFGSRIIAVALLIGLALS